MTGLGGAMKTAGFSLKQPAVDALTEFRTPLDKVFFVYHMGVPNLDAATWRLSIGGLVEREISVSLADLAAFEPVEVTAFHECAGSPLRPTEPVRRVANVVWRGVRLADVLRGAGVKPAARYLWSYGADHGMFGDVESPCYLKDLPIAETARGDVLLATHVNGDALSEERGAPVRLVVPGYYGTNSTKWLVRLEPREIRAQGHFTTTLYNDRIMLDGRAATRPVWRVAPHAVIVAPAASARLPRRAQQVSGWAWGAREIAQVEVSTDGGARWRTARLSPRQQHAWQGFSYDWTPEASGAVELCCRATDCNGEGQPEHGARNAVFRLAVDVE